MDGRWKEFIFYLSGLIFKIDWNTDDDDEDDNHGNGNDNNNNNKCFLKFVIALFARSKEVQFLL
jgi:hypothetical protein